jgi:hypothetical protein
MAAFPGILQSPFVVATDRAIGRSQVGSLTAMEVATRDFDPVTGKPVSPALINPMARCIGKRVTDADRTKCEADCQAKGALRGAETACVLSCTYKWTQEQGCVLWSHCGYGENCPDIEDPGEVQTPWR